LAAKLTEERSNQLNYAPTAVASGPARLHLGNDWTVDSRTLVGRKLFGADIKKIPRLRGASRRCKSLGQPDEEAQEAVH